MAHEVLEHLRSLSATLDSCAASGTSERTRSMEPDEIAEAMRLSTAVQARVEGQFQCPLAAEASSRKLHRRYGASSVKDLIAGWTRTTPAEAGRLVRLASRLASGRFTATAEAFAAGEINRAHAAGVVEAVRKLPSGEIGADDLAAAESTMLDTAREADPQVVEKAGHALSAHIAPEAADEVEGERLERERRRAEASRWLQVHGYGARGGKELRFRAENATITKLLHVIDPLVEPLPDQATGIDSMDDRPFERRRADAFADAIDLAFAPRLDNMRSSNTPRDAAEDHEAAECVSSDDHDGSEVLRFPFTYPYPVAHTEDFGLAESIDSPYEQSDSGGETHEQRPHPGPDRTWQPPRTKLFVRLDYDQLRERLGTGTFDNNEQLSPVQIARMACDADLVPVWTGMDPTGTAVAATGRYFRGKHLAALIDRDFGCVFPGCSRGLMFVHAHHVTPYRISGHTTVHEGVLLCGHHHRLIHDGEWTVRIATDGKPEFLPPRWLDPTQQPRRHVRHGSPSTYAA